MYTYCIGKKRTKAKYRNGNTTDSTHHAEENYDVDNSVADPTDEQPEHFCEPAAKEDIQPTVTTSESAYYDQTVEFAHADGSLGTVKEIDLTAHKMTVLRINQLVHNTGKLLATHQQLSTGIMEKVMEQKIATDKL